MVRKMFALALVVAFASMAQVYAGDGHEDMMKSMMNCTMCSKMAPHMAELEPVLKGEIVELNNGMAMIHTITDAKKVDAYHTVSLSMQEVGAECMAYSDADAKEKLCDHCNGIRSAINAGANFSMGLTENGDMMVLTSEKPEVQAKIDAVQKNFETMMASH